MIPANERVAAIDVGSNTILYTVAEYHPVHGLSIIEEGEDQPRLGAGLSATGRLSDEAAARAISSLTRIRNACHRLGVGRLAAVATAAVREAANGAEFIERVRELDVPLRIISPETEAALSYRSAAHHFPGGGRTLAADIGGGSLELTGANAGTITLTESVPLGAVRLTETNLPLEPLRAHIARVLKGPLQTSAWHGSRVIGSGGTFATLASMALARRGAGTQQIHGTVVTAGEVNQLLELLANIDPEARRQTAGLKPERADIIVAGLAVVIELLDLVKTPEVTVSGFGLRDGLLLEMLGIK